MCTIVELFERATYMSSLMRDKIIQYLLASWFEVLHCAALSLRSRPSDQGDWILENCDLAMHKMEKGLVQDTGNEGLPPTPGFFNSFVQFLDEKFPLVERHHIHILKFEPLHAPHVLAWRSCQWENLRRVVEETDLKRQTEACSVNFDYSENMFLLFW